MKWFIQPRAWFLTCCLLLVANSGLFMRRALYANASVFRPVPPTVHRTSATSPALYLPMIIQHTNTEPGPGDTVYTGEATYYAATGGGNCSFDPTPDNLMVAALNTTDYANARLCGAFVEVSGPGGSAVVRIVDRCPGCAPGDIDLSREAFAAIADPALGRVPVQWRVVSPELAGPVVYHFKDGSNPYWTAVQVRNHRNPVATLEYQAADGTFRPVERLMYNYFVEPAGMGAGPYTFRITDIYGNSLLDSGIVPVENAEVAGSAQFPVSP